MDVTLKPVDKSNWEDIAALNVSSDQADFIAPNVYSLAEAAYDKACVPLGIFCGKEAVGFLMYESQESEGKAGEFNIFRFMIDEAHQNKGIGRIALKKALSRMSSLPECKRITICYLPDNSVAKSFYESVGFSEVGLDDSGEMIAEVNV